MKPSFVSLQNQIYLRYNDSDAVLRSVLLRNHHFNP